MKAVVIHQAGGAEVLILSQVPTPTPLHGQVLIRIKAFGLNRSELFTRQGHSPNVKFPRILGIEATGLVAACPGGEFAKDAVVITAMGGLGRDIDGGYAEYVLLRTEAVVRVPSDVDPVEYAPILCAGITVFNSIRKQNITLGELVAIQGLGGLGHLAVQCEAAFLPVLSR